MEDVISTEWQLLYANNPKIQTFGICKAGKVVWQTSNWDIVDAVDSISNATKTAAEKVKIGRIEYYRLSSTKNWYIGSAKKNKGHLIIDHIQGDAWVVVSISADATPDLAKIDVARTAVNLIGTV